SRRRSSSAHRPSWRFSVRFLRVMPSLPDSVIAAPEETGASAGFRHYGLYGISLRSEIPLTYPERPADAVPDVTFSLKPDRWFAEVRARIPDTDIADEWWYSHAQRRDGSVYLRWHDWFEFVISADGRTIACGRLGHATPESFQTYLLGPVL